MKCMHENVLYIASKVRDFSIVTKNRNKKLFKGESAFVHLPKYANVYNLI